MRAVRMIENVRRRGAAAARAAGVIAATALAVLSLSCGEKPKPSEPRIPREVDVPEYLRDTVGEVARFAGREGVSVQGYGFVTGLDGTGTKVMPPGIRQQIIDMMRRHKVSDVTEILSSPDNAVVMVMGIIPPGLAKGEAFDLEVHAVSTTETTSLDGGFLLECNLTRVVASRGVEAKSEILATGRGSIFVSPFASEDKGKDKGKETIDPRAGRILAGGRSAKTRHFRLVLLSPSVRIVDQIVRLVNARFPGAAKGTEDPSRVDLAVPAEYLDDNVHFLDLVGAIYLRESPESRDHRVNVLVEALKKGEDLDRIALCVEAMGANVAPRLRPLATHENEAVRFHVGRTLANLQDAQSVAALEPIALKDGSGFQESAVEALGRLKSGIGLGVLGRALSAKSSRVRVAAWQAMTRISPRMFVAEAFKDKFILSVVPSKAEPFVYVSRTMKPRVAIFGDVTLRPPVVGETRRVLISATEGAKQITLISRWHGKDYHVQAALGLKDLIDKLARPLVPPVEEGKSPPAADAPPEGLGLSYSDVVGVLHELSRKKALGAPLMLQPLMYRSGGERMTTRPVAEKED
jgi:flagellar basal body P-ring protein FlgI